MQIYFGLYITNQVGSVQFLLEEYATEVAEITSHVLLFRHTAGRLIAGICVLVLKYKKIVKLIKHQTIRVYTICFSSLKILSYLFY